jgi:hypothetical protein
LALNELIEHSSSVAAKGGGRAANGAAGNDAAALERFEEHVERLVGCPG